ncbi:hypothetical protein [Leucobacter sp. NPDC077196]|uniref:hypothetical protein n=1 Tax=Leucobacter sp. NPDC077196 TaxID=3154959 RepID=UPI003423600F
MPSTRARPSRFVLVALLIVAALVLVAAAAVTVPIVLHRSAGGSGQEIPTSIVSETSALGADGRTRTLRAVDADGPAKLDAIKPGDSLRIEGSGFDVGIGIYVAVCAVPASSEVKPGPCLGGIPEGAESGAVDDAQLTSAWVTNDWAWRSFATHQYSDASEGRFAVTLTVPEPSSDGLDCREVQCAVATRADHTAGADRVQDMLLPVAYG